MWQKFPYATTSTHTLSSYVKSIQTTKNGLLVVGEEFIAISSNKSDPTTMMMTG